MKRLAGLGRTAIGNQAPLTLTMLPVCGRGAKTMHRMRVETEDGNVILTARQREEAPYLVLVDPLGARGAAYNNRHKLIVDDVSPALLAFAKNRYVKSSAWVDEHDDGPRERPSWMPMGSLLGWQLYWVRDGASDQAHYEALPLN